MCSSRLEGNGRRSTTATRRFIELSVMSMPDVAHARRAFTTTTFGAKSVRPLVLGRRGAVSAGHYLAARAGERMFDLGGSAIDAGIAAGLALNVLLFQWADFGGVAPIMLYHAKTDRLVTIDGLGVWPRNVDINQIRSGGQTDGVLWTVTPAAPDAWLTALAEFGSLALCDVLEPALDLASNGAPVSVDVARSLAEYEDHVRERYPTTLNAFYPEDRVFQVGEILYRPELALVFKSLLDTEAAARRQGRDRAEAIRDARDVFYRGWIAEEIAQFFQREGGWLTERDLGDYHVDVGEPLRTSYRGMDVYSCGPWCQGPVLLQMLNMLESYDIASLEHNGPDYLHLVAEVIARAYADRERFYGDPRKVKVPIHGLLSKEFARARATTIDPRRATGELPPAGDPWRYEGSLDPAENVGVRVSAQIAETRALDTTYCAAADADGNIFSATPSDSALLTAVVPSLGFACSWRGVQSRLDQNHPAAIAPGRRPRLTPNPTMLGVDGVPMVAIGCPGGDIQPQGMLQTILNAWDFGMNLQQSVEAPRIASWNFPNSFAPHTYDPGRLDVEARIAADTRENLRRRGHAV